MSTNHRLPQMSGDQFLNQFSSALALSRPGVSFLEQSQSKEGGTVYLLRSGVPFSKTIPFNSEESESEEVGGNEEQSSIGGDEP